MILATGGTIAGAAATGTQSGYTSGAVTHRRDVAGGAGHRRTSRTSRASRSANVGSQDMSFDILLKVAKRINELLPSRPTSTAS